MQETSVQILTKVIESVEGQPREGQIKMAEETAKAISSNKHSLVSAGTGVGKSFAYLSSALSQKTEQPIVVVTATKALQEQLVLKDLPVMSKMWEEEYGEPLNFMKALGISNFFCHYKAEETQDKVSKGEELLTPEDKKILEWGRTTYSGDKSEMDFEPSFPSWGKFSVGAGECLGRKKCPKAETCFALKAKQRYFTSDIVVANTALYAIYLMTGMNEFILPNHDIVIFDECHKMPDAIRSAMATKLNKYNIARIASLHDKHFKGTDGKNSDSISESIKQEAEKFETILTGRMDKEYSIARINNISKTDPEIMESLKRILDLVDESEAKMMKEMRRVGHNEKLVLQFEMTLKGIVNFKEKLGELWVAAQGQENTVVWLSKENKHFSLNLSNINIDKFLEENLWESPVKSILCSATVPSKLHAELGLKNYITVDAPSPFNYKENSKLFIPAGMPAGNDRDNFFEATLPEIQSLIELTEGRTLLLFTSWKAMNETYEEMEIRLPRDYTLMKQGEKPKGLLVEDFKNSPKACLFGTQSFWEGISIDGDSCVSVIIDKIPFSSPNDPILQAIREKAGKKAFYDVDIPHASTTLAQGVGRLIRTVEDKGIVTILDSRLAEKNYRKDILDELPNMGRVRDKKKIEEFVKEKL